MDDPTPLPKEQLKTSPATQRQVTRATVWTVGSHLASNVLRLVSNLILARLLFPEAFAMLALAGILISGLRMFSDIGLGSSVIQSRNGEDQAFLNTAWTLQIIRGTWLFAGSCLLATPFAVFYEVPELLWIVPVAGFSALISGFNSIALHAGVRKLALGRLAILELGESTIKLVVTITWAFVSPSVWAILGGALVGQLAYTVGTHLLLQKHSHRLAWSRQAVTEFVRFGGWVFLSSAVTFLGQQSDRLLLGKLVTLDVLGVYSLALMFSRLPLDICLEVSSRVLFPALASIVRETPEKLADSLYNARSRLLTASVAVTVLFMAASQWFFYFAYDERYSKAVWMAPLMALAMWFGILQLSIDRTLLAIGDTRSLFVSNVVNFVVTVGGSLAGFHVFGLPGLIAGIALGKLVAHLVVMFKLAAMRIVKPLQDLRYGTIMLASYGVVVWLPSGWSMAFDSREGLIRLAFQVTACFVAAFFGYAALGKGKKGG